MAHSSCCSGRVSVSQIFALTKGWLTLETSSETLYGSQFTTWYQTGTDKTGGKVLETCYGGQFTTSLKLIKPNYLVIPSAM